MNASDWTCYVPNDSAVRRAGGRRRYNNYRQFVALLRRRKVASICPFKHGEIARLARQLGVSRSTISRDFSYIQDLARQRRLHDNLRDRLLTAAASLAPPQELPDQVEAFFDGRPWAVRGGLPQILRTI